MIRRVATGALRWHASAGSAELRLTSRTIRRCFGHLLYVHWLLCCGSDHCRYRPTARPAAPTASTLISPTDPLVHSEPHDAADLRLQLETDTRTSAQGKLTHLLLALQCARSQDRFAYTCRSQSRTSLGHFAACHFAAGRTVPTAHVDVCS